jgi:anti-sigma factor RsiW
MMLKHMPLMITCRQFEDFILAYLEGELPEKQRFVFELHLKVCRECRDYLAAYRRTIEISKRVFENPDRAVPDEVPEDLVKAVLDARNC